MKIIINIPKRTERLKKALDTLQNFFGENYFIVSEGVVMENTTHAVREAHKNAVRLAKNNNQKSALIFEDDVLMRDGALPYYNELIENLPDDYDIVLFGIYSGQIYETENLFFDKVNKFSGLQMYLVNERAYDKILSYTGGQPIDHWLGLNLNCYISKKHFSYQSDGWSDNAKTFTNYNTDVLPTFKDYFFRTAPK